MFVVGEYGYFDQDYLFVLDINFSILLADIVVSIFLSFLN